MKACVSHNVREEYIKENFFTFLRYVRNKYKKYLKNQYTHSIPIDDKKQKLKILKNEYKLLVSQKITTINKNPDSIEYIQQTYAELEKQKLLEIKKLSALLEQKPEDAKKTIKNDLVIIDEILDKKVIHKYMLETLLDHIIIHHDKTIEFKLKVNIDDLFSK